MVKVPPTTNDAANPETAEDEDMDALRARVSVARDNYLAGCPLFIRCTQRVNPWFLYKPEYRVPVSVPDAEKIKAEPHPQLIAGSSNPESVVGRESKASEKGEGAEEGGKGLFEGQEANTGGEQIGGPDAESEAILPTTQLRENMVFPRNVTPPSLPVKSQKAGTPKVPNPKEMKRKVTAGPTLIENKMPSPSLRLFLDISPSSLSAGDAFAPDLIPLPNSPLPQSSVGSSSVPGASQSASNSLKRKRSGSRRTSQVVREVDGESDVREDGRIRGLTVAREAGQRTPVLNASRVGGSTASREKTPDVIEDGEDNGVSKSNLSPVGRAASSRGQTPIIIEDGEDNAAMLNASTAGAASTSREQTPIVIEDEEENGVAMDAEQTIPAVETPPISSHRVTSMSPVAGGADQRSGRSSAAGNHETQMSYFHSIRLVSDEEPMSDDEGDSAAAGDRTSGASTPISRDGNDWINDGSDSQPDSPQLVPDEEPMEEEEGGEEEGGGRGNEGGKDELGGIAGKTDEVGPGKREERNLGRKSGQSPPGVNSLFDLLVGDHTAGGGGAQKSMAADPDASTVDVEEPAIAPDDAGPLTFSRSASTRQSMPEANGRKSSNSTHVQRGDPSQPSKSDREVKRRRISAEDVGAPVQPLIAATPPRHLRSLAKSDVRTPPLKSRSTSSAASESGKKQLSQQSTARRKPDPFDFPAEDQESDPDRVYSLDAEPQGDFTERDDVVSPRKSGGVTYQTRNTSPSARASATASPRKQNSFVSPAKRGNTMDPGSNRQSPKGVASLLESPLRTSRPSTPPAAVQRQDSLFDTILPADSPSHHSLSQSCDVDDMIKGIQEFLEHDLDMSKYAQSREDESGKSGSQRRSALLANSLEDEEDEEVEVSDSDGGD
ncbi:hypothetical protein HK104_007482 [Borealophlyctis nickersoniae]|nr:hypothetical protein HK104_007482 [Borealophlyctis nickersoniae]